MAVSNPKSGPSGRRSNRRRGQAMVEFAMVIPIFLLILAGIIDFGLGLFFRMTVINAARDGARAAVMVSNTATIPGPAGVAEARARAAATQGGLDVSSVTETCLRTTVSVTSPPACGNWNNYNASTNPTGPQSGDSVSVTVNYKYQIHFPMLTLLGIKEFDLSSTVQMVIE
jgi:Flp pilus assembly protein TadG